MMVPCIIRMDGRTDDGAMHNPDGRTDNGAMHNPDGWTDDGAMHEVQAI